MSKKTLLDLGVIAQERDRILLALHEGKYNLLLGAGASYGCHGGNSYELKDGATVSEDINRDFALGLNSEECRRLVLTYEEAASINKAGLANWLKVRFTGCKSTWQCIIFKFSWQRIWTFNIDDLLFDAFNKCVDARAKASLRQIDWKQGIVPVSECLDAQQLIYLHGRARDMGTKDEGLIFSVAEYAAATRGFGQWHACFQTHYIEDPFIVCGASLAEEVDIAEAIRSKSQSSLKSGAPSILVSFSLDSGQVQRMRRYNLIPIVCSIDEFLGVLESDLRSFRDGLEQTYAGLPHGHHESFLSQFRRLELGRSAMRGPEGTDFYGGDQPVWGDILADMDVCFSTTNSALNVLDSRTKRYCALIHGHPISGKTTSLLRIAHSAVERGHKAYWFRHEVGLNPKVVASFLAVEERAVLFIDDAADHTEGVGRLLEICESEGTSARVFLATRSARRRGFEMDIPDRFVQEIYQGDLIKRDLTLLVEKRRAMSRLGAHYQSSNEKLVWQLKNQCGAQLLSCISMIEFSEPLRMRVRKIILSACEDSAAKHLIARIACVHRFGFSLPLRAALTASGMPFQAFGDLLNGERAVDGPIVRDERGVRLRHRIYSEYVWEDCFKESERYEAMASVVQSLAPLVNPLVIRAKQVEHLILREVLDQESVSRSIGVRALEFYEDHERLLGWSSRYWDQRALLESRIGGHFSKAYSYSQKAISLERHPFAFTSFGSICMTQAIRVAEADPLSAIRLFDEGEGALSTACDLAVQQNMLHEHPYVKYFASTCSILRKLKPGSTEFHHVLQRFDAWIIKARASPVFAHHRGQDKVKDLERTLFKERLRASR